MAKRPGHRIAGGSCAGNRSCFRDGNVANSVSGRADIRAGLCCEDKVQLSGSHWLQTCCGNYVRCEAKSQRQIIRYPARSLSDAFCSHTGTKGPDCRPSSSGIGPMGNSNAAAGRAIDRPASNPLGGDPVPRPRPGGCWRHAAFEKEDVGFSSGTRMPRALGRRSTRCRIGCDRQTHRKR